MHFVFLPLLLLLLLPPSPTTASGINCDGGFLCALSPVGGHHAWALMRYLSAIEPQRWYAPGQLIACHQPVCAFVQHSGRRMQGWRIKQLARELVHFGCQNCGSVPVDYPRAGAGAGAGANEGRVVGELTFNAVGERKMCPNGLC
ncbi:MAG: hypothetical protein M1826_005220 [Phylliscum demangeonii]|nr:MAG: hypothetical protein M1826_005220 [Phylliscum demangeonii]